MSIAAGVGGGAFFVPLFNVLLQFSEYPMQSLGAICATMIMLAMLSDGLQPCLTVEAHQEVLSCARVPEHLLCHNENSLIGFIWGAVLRYEALCMQA